MVPSGDDAADLRRSLAGEVGRRGVDAVARRLRVPTASLEEIIAGGGDPRLLSVISSVKLHYADLEQFLSSYFYEGYYSETGAVQAWAPAVDTFLDLESRETILGTIEDLRQLMESRLSDSEIARVLESLGCRFAVARSGYTPSGWVAAVLNRLEREMGLSSSHG